MSGRLHRPGMRVFDTETWPTMLVDYAKLEVEAAARMLKAFDGAFPEMNRWRNELLKERVLWQHEPKVEKMRVENDGLVCVVAKKYDVTDNWWVRCVTRCGAHVWHNEEKRPRLTEEPATCFACLVAE